MPYLVEMPRSARRDAIFDKQEKSCTIQGGNSGILVNLVDNRLNLWKNISSLSVLIVVNFLGWYRSLGCWGPMTVGPMQKLCVTVRVRVLKHTRMLVSPRVPLVRYIRRTSGRGSASPIINSRSAAVAYWTPLTSTTCICVSGLVSTTQLRLHSTRL